MYYNLIMRNTRSHLKTIRLSRLEETALERFLAKHPHLGNFSTVVRAALWDFMKENSPERRPDTERPSFLWEYDLTNGEIHEILEGPQSKRLWLVAKILEHGKWDEIWKYLTVEGIAADLPHLRLPEKSFNHWHYAMDRWRRRSWQS